MDRRLILAGAALALVAFLLVANAAAFAYRWLAGTVVIGGPEQAAGAACTGFYSSADQQNIPLPPAGTNYNAPTYGGNRIQVTPGQVVCQQGTYTLYESIDVTLPLTVGAWYIKDLYGFGYLTGTGPVYVTLVVEDAATEISGLTAQLIVYKGTNVVATLDLTVLGAKSGIITLNQGEALILDLRIDSPAAGQVTFKVGFYVSQEQEQP